MTVERPEAFVFFGPQTVQGAELQPGDRAPDFRLLTNKVETVTMAQYAGKPLLISVVPSLDTGVCSRQTVRFNQEAAGLADQASFLTVSADLPFAQSRFCGANDTTAIQTLSDHRDMNFGAAYGTYVVSHRIEQRAVFVIDADGVVRHAEYVPVAGQEPDYDRAMAALRALI
jgi:thioredoxin-dependent peroxiredoxin